MQNWVIISLAVITMVIFIVGMALWFAHERRKLIHTERMAMIEKGLMPASLSEATELLGVSPTQDLHSGIVTVLVGLALLLGLGTLGLGPWLVAGLIPLAIGIGQIISHLITTSPPKYQSDEQL